MSRRARWDGRRPIKGNGTNLIVRHLTVAGRLALPRPASPCLSFHTLRWAFQLMHSGRVRRSGSRQVHLLSKALVTDVDAEMLLLGRPFFCQAESWRSEFDSSDTLISTLASLASAFQHLLWLAEHLVEKKGHISTQLSICLDMCVHCNTAKTCTNWKPEGSEGSRKDSEGSSEDSEGSSSSGDPQGSLVKCRHHRLMSL